MILIYMEDAPLNENTDGYGLEKVNGNILETFKLADQNFTVFCPNITGKYKRDEVVDQVKYLGRHLSKMSRLLYHLTPLQNLKFKFELSSFLRIRENYVRILCVAGADINTIERSNVLSKKIGTEYDLFLVDDIISYSQRKYNYPKNELIQKVGNHIKEARKVFYITNGLKMFYTNLFGFHNSEVVGLPYLESKSKVFNDHTLPQKNQVIHVGNTKDFYHEGLTDFLNLLTKYNKHNEPLKLRLTLKEIPKEFKKYSEHIITSRFPNDEDLYAEISRSKAAFLPYSFQDKYAKDIVCSFPSKSILYLKYSTHIIYYGPKKSSFYEIFGSNYKFDFFHSKKDLNQVFDLIGKKSFNYSEELDRIKSTFSRIAENID